MYLQGLSAVSACNITMYNISVMDQHSPTIVTVPANMSSVEFLYNGTSIVVNREYTITVSAISDQGISYTSNAIVIGEFYCILSMYTYICSYVYMRFAKRGLYVQV